jgi:ABC-type sulfate/molybdate transport systems ATPase subunit/ABC-type sulfate transport system permease component
MPFLGGLLVLYLLVPVALLLVHLLEGGPGMSTDGLASATWISVLTATVATLIIALLGIPLAWLLAERRGAVWQAIGLAVQLPLALPPLMSGILLIEVVGPYTTLGRLFGGGLTDTRAAIVLAQTFVAAPFLVVAARSAFATVDPGLYDVAATLGHGGFSRFWRVSLPLAGPGIRAGLLLAWLRAFGEFGATIILAYHPYSLPVFTFVQFSSTGLPSALPPTAVALGVAALVLGLVHWRPGHRILDRLATVRPGDQPVPAAQTLDGSSVTADWTGGRRSPPTPLAFDLQAAIGSFELRLAHAGEAQRLAILGPSGAGKSFTLRCLAGLRGRGVGRVRLGNREISQLAPEARRIGWVPQDAGLFPHLTVWRQLTFGVDTDRRRAVAWLGRLGLNGLEDRLPDQLSGGQRQRVALARALARTPDLLLLDEPFSSLDRPVRDELRRELRRLQQQVDVATVLVTHDPEEAALLCDEVVILDQGRALQAGSRAVVFARPASPQVARLLAIDNLRHGQILEPGRLCSEGTEFEVAANGLPAGADVAWCLRAEHVVVRPGDGGPVPGSDAGAERPAVVLDAMDLGAWVEVTVRLSGGLTLTARTVDGRGLQPGNGCRVRFSPADVTVWRPEAAQA